MKLSLNQICNLFENERMLKSVLSIVTGLSYYEMNSSESEMTSDHLIAAKKLIADMMDKFPQVGEIDMFGEEFTDDREKAACKLYNQVIEDLTTICCVI